MTYTSFVALVSSYTEPLAQLRSKNVLQHVCNSVKLLPNVIIIHTKL